MTLVWEQVIVDSADPIALGRWWAEALGWMIVDEDVDDPDGPFLEIRPTPDQLPGLLFGASSDAKTTKNRLHLDFRPDDHDAEVERFLALGATRADVGQTGAEPWVVLADPEGNEFCILSSRRPAPTPERPRPRSVVRRRAHPSRHHADEGRDLGRGVVGQGDVELGGEAGDAHDEPARILAHQRHPA